MYYSLFLLWAWPSPYLTAHAFDEEMEMSQKSSQLMFIQNKISKQERRCGIGVFVQKVFQSFSLSFSMGRSQKTQP